MKGKSNLMLAILTFGYQVLLYPHFAELCWATSKLKEGPCADIAGPWRGWPFNSCIIRPKDSLEGENLAVACGSANKNVNKKSGVVRGLTAIGLLAYRGMYTSPREVSSEVRKVLELLAVRIHAKIDAGSDKYNFGRLLSQVAYLEDLVNSWAYLLQSLEIHGQVTEADPRLASLGPHDRNKICEDKPTAENSLHEAESRSPLNLNITDTGSIPLNIDEHHGQQHGNVKATLGDINVELLNGKDCVIPQTHELENSGNEAKVNKVPGPISNGYTRTDSIISLKDGPCALGADVLSSDDIDATSENGNMISSKDVNGNCSLNGITNPPGDCSFLCLYRCCSKCLVKLQQLVRKNLYYQRGLRGSQWTVEDVHDCVKSSSVHLHSEVRNFCLSENPTSLLGENVEHSDHIQLVEGQKTKVCRCKNSGNKFIRPVECTSHLRIKSATAEVSSGNPRELELELIYKDGVLISVDPTDDVSWHCKFENLCLCSLIEWIDKAAF